MPELTPVFVAVLPILVFSLVLWLHMRWRQSLYKLPLTTRLLRPPGESLRIKIEELSEKIYERFFYSFLSCGSLGIGVAMVQNNPLAYVLIIIGLGFFIYFAARIWKLGCEVRDCRLGFLGERAVGEELNQLLASGWKVFHDVEFHDNPSHKPFNIDHVVVGTGGVFAIETKTRRKRVKRKQDDPKNEVIFNGSTLIYPWGEERLGVDQAIKGAAHLAQWLQKKKIKESAVQSVLALPGWMVRRKGKSDLRVISGREVANLFRDEDKKQCLTPETAERIIALLDQKCRDVEW